MSTTCSCGHHRTIVSAQRSTTMIVHSDSDLSFIPVLLLILAGFFGVSIAVMLMVGRNFRAAAKTLAAVAGLSLAYVVVVIAVSLLSPQKVVDIGDSYCEDIWCIGIERVNVEPLDGSKKYDVAVRIFSVANSTDISAKGASLYLMDERERLFPSIRNTEAVPFDTI